MENEKEKQEKRVAEIVKHIESFEPLQAAKIINIMVEMECIKAKIEATANTTKIAIESLKS